MEPFYALPHLPIFTHPISIPFNLTHLNNLSLYLCRIHPAFFTAEYRREISREGAVTLGLMTLLSREREEGEIYRQKHGVKYHASTITINSELQKWKKQKANRDQRREKLLTGKVLV